MSTQANGPACVLSLTASDWNDYSTGGGLRQQVFGEDGPQRFEARKDLRLLCAEAALGCVCFIRRVWVWGGGVCVSLQAGVGGWVSFVALCWIGGGARRGRRCIHSGFAHLTA